MKKLFAAGMAVFISCVVQAQDQNMRNEMMVDSLEDVVISARVSPISQNKGQSVVVITADQIRNLPVTTLDELLRYLPGMDIQQRGPFGTQSDINARGSRFNQNLVVVNGIPANDPLTGHFNGNFMVSPGEIERIEIVRGPSSLAYGGASIGVTIHIYTYGFDAGMTDTTELANRVRLSFGSYEQQDMEFEARMNKEKFYIGGSIWNYNHRGPERPDSSHTYAERKQYALYAGGKFTDNLRIAVRGFISESEFDARNFYTASSADRSIEWLDRNKGEAALFYTSDKGISMDFRYSYLQTKDKFAFVPTAVNNHDSRLHTVQWNTRYRIGKSSYAFGFQGLSGKLESNDRGNREKQYGDVYAIASHLFGKTGLSYGVRLRVDDEGNMNVMPQVWANEYLGKFVLRGGVSMATRSATYTELYVSTGLPELANGRNLGNPLLTDEVTLNAEAGADWKPLKGLTVGMGVWARSSSDLIDYIYTPGSEIPDATNIRDTFSYFYATNLGSMTNVGAELTISHSGHNNSGLYWQYVIGHSFNKLLESEDFEDTKYLLSTARNLLNVSGVITYKWMRVSTTIVYKEREQAEVPNGLQKPTPQYLIWNPAIGAVIPGGYIELSARNIFDTKYTDIGGVEQPGRWYVVSVKTNF